MTGDALKQVIVHYRITGAKNWESCADFRSVVRQTTGRPTCKRHKEGVLKFALNLLLVFLLGVFH